MMQGLEPRRQDEEDEEEERFGLGNGGDGGYDEE
jgi:hypothetical protein